MATTTGSKPTAESAAAATATAAAAEPTILPRPIVYEGRKKKKKKRYSRGLKSPQKLEQGVSRAMERLAEAVADGLSEYRRSRNKSAQKKRDGAIKDALRNVGRGAEEALRTGAKAPTDLTKRMSARRLTQLVVPPQYSMR